MAKRLVWTDKAKKSRKEIFDFWNNYTDSKTYSQKLNRLFNETAKLLINFPKIGRPTTFQGVRVKNIRTYLIFYRIKNDDIQILLIWDTRRNPDDLRNIRKAIISCQVFSYICMFSCHYNNFV